MTLGAGITEPSWRVHFLDGCRAKVVRAYELIEELKAGVDEWLASHEEMSFGLAEAEWGSPSSKWFVLMPHLDRPPLRIAVLFSEVLHNLRSCLDQLIVNMVLANGEHPGKIQFPYCQTQAEWDRLVRKSELGRVSPWALDALRQRQPFADGEVLLLLQEASNREKHNYLFPVSIGLRDGMGTPAVTAGGQNCSLTRLFDFMAPLHADQPLYEFQAPAGSSPLMKDFGMQLRVGFGLVRDGSLGIDLWHLRAATAEVGTIVNLFTTMPPTGHEPGWP